MNISIPLIDSFMRIYAIYCTFKPFKCETTRGLITGQNTLSALTVKPFMFNMFSVLHTQKKSFYCNFKLFTSKTTSVPQTCYSADPYRSYSDRTCCCRLYNNTNQATKDRKFTSNFCNYICNAYFIYKVHCYFTFD